MSASKKSFRLPQSPYSVRMERRRKAQELEKKMYPEDTASYYIYLIRAKFGDQHCYYKIGVSKDPELTGACPIAPRVMYKHATPYDRKAAYTVEAELHRSFADRRTNGEWFAFDDEEVKKVIIKICRVDIERKYGRDVLESTANEWMRAWNNATDEGPL